MTELDRRRLLALGAVALGSTVAGARGATPARLSLRPGETLNDIPRDYNGFSAETAQLSDPAFFSPANRSLVALYRRLSPNGVLRLGGNSSEFCWWKASADAQPPASSAPGQGRADNFMPQHFTPITPEAIDNLRGFLDATGWTCIYGLNLGTGSPERDAEEAFYVAHALGTKLRFFQIGNEPDLYRKSSNLLRPADWDFAAYMNQWTPIARAVLDRVPEARFGGPDGPVEWTAQFAGEAPRRIGARIAALSAHYYAEGPPDSPHATIANLLKGDPRVAASMDAIMPAARAAGLAFRMTEGNSCYRGGKPGMSNAFASALWAGDYLLDMAARGCKGVNLHGGPGATIAAGLGDKLPGARNAADLEIARLGTFYSPIAGSPALGFSARPIFYGMMLVEQFAGRTLIANTFDPLGANATAYAARAPEGYRIALFNKDAARDLDVRIDLAGLGTSSAMTWRLRGPAPDATSGVTLAGAEIEPVTARYEPQNAQPLRVGASLTVALPRASAVLLSLLS